MRARKRRNDCIFCGSTNLERLSEARRRCRDCGRAFAAPAIQMDNSDAIKERLARSRRQETQGMKRLGGRVTAASGATRWQKADGTTSKRGEYPRGLRVEFKSTVRKSYSLKLDEMLKLRKAVEGDEIPVFVVELDANGAREEFYVFPRRIAEMLLELYDGPRNG